MRHAGCLAPGRRVPQGRADLRLNRARHRLSDPPRDLAASMGPRADQTAVRAEAGGAEPDEAYVARLRPAPDAHAGARAARVVGLPASRPPRGCCWPAPAPGSHAVGPERSKSIYTRTDRGFRSAHGFAPSRPRAAVLGPGQAVGLADYPRFTFSPVIDYSAFPAHNVRVQSGS